MTGRAPHEGRARSVSGGSVRTTGGGIHPVMALSDFMPYGAPELLEGASPRLARSTLLASGFVAVLIWCLGMVAANRSVERELPPVYVPPYDFHPEQFNEPKRDDGGFKVRPPKAAVSEYKPVITERPFEQEIEEPGPVGPV